MIDVQEHLGLANLQANRVYEKFYLQDRYDYEDILQMCYVGLVKAARKFDETKGFKFSTFACKWMWGWVMSNILRDKYYPAKEKYKHLKSFVYSTDAVVPNCEDKEMTYIDLISDPENEIENCLNSMALKQALKKLPDKHRNVIYFRYFKNKTQTEIAKILGTDQANISRTEKAALKKLKEYIN